MKKVIIAILIIILVPILIVTGLYFTVKPFQEMADEVLVYAPFGIGDKIASKPSSAEVDKQVSEVAAYLLSLGQDRAIDKMNVIKSDDRAVYDDIVKAMIRLSPNKTEKLLEAIKMQNQQGSALSNALAQIDEERTAEIKSKADFITALDIDAATAEIKRILDEEVGAHKLVGDIYQQLSAQKILEINTGLRENDILKINKNLTVEKLNEIKTLENKQVAASRTLEENAKILAEKKASELAELVGNTNTYPMEELAKIYQVLGPKLGGQVLALVDNESFANELSAAIADNCRLKGKTDDFSKDLYKSLNIYKDYDDNLKELVQIYENVDEAKVAETVRKLYWNSDKVEVYQLDNGETISISDQELALDLLKSFAPEKIASILSRLDDNISTEILSEIALPSLK